jgi:hypothetical protein
MTGNKCLTPRVSPVWPWTMYCQQWVPRECSLRDLDGSTVVLASPDGPAQGEAS